MQEKGGRIKEEREGSHLVLKQIFVQVVLQKQLASVCYKNFHGRLEPCTNIGAVKPVVFADNLPGNNTETGGTGYVSNICPHRES